MENELAQLSINDEEEEIIHIPIDPNRENRGEIFQLVGCFLTASTIHFPAMKSTMANLWHPVKGGFERFALDLLQPSAGPLQIGIRGGPTTDPSSSDTFLGS
ncbi:hypothetical protein Goari_010239, partial [Gossypium aridum]|nr:hypothetical protein [Gossypium aridum]